MKLQYKIQSFQTEAAKAVVDVFAGQQNVDTWQYVMDKGKAKEGEIEYADVLMGTRNADINISDEDMLKNVNAIQHSSDIAPSQDLQRGGDELRLTVEMETGTGKTYTYIKTMFELNKHYGWTKFIVVVPSVAIREGVLKSFDSMREHFVHEYGQVIDHFVYNSDHLNRIDTFAQNSGISAMIINYQAFAASGAEARKIYKRLDSFRSRKPIEVISAMHPIMIIDEPQSVLGADKKNVTRKMLAEFKPLFSILYSATHRKDDIRNMIFRLDAVDAYQRHLVKKISVKGVEVTSTNATGGFVYINEVRPDKNAGPVAVVSFDKKAGNGLRQTTMTLRDKADLYELSGGLEEYHNGYIIDMINAHDGSVRLQNGKKLYCGDSIGNLNEDIKRRIQIRETIVSHLQREEQLFNRGIKVLSLFFIDEVKKYRNYENEEDTKGIYAKVFEEEYERIVANYVSRLNLDEFKAFNEYLRSFKADQVHNGYFSQDKKGHIIDSKVSRGAESSDDQSAYDLIMKNKERLLSFDEPTRFIFSHSALKEGWDNPNVFQICTLKDPDASDDCTRKRQEVGRGLRLCVNQQGVRQDERELGEKGVFDVNLLTVIASESYDSFARDLQKGIAAAVSNRPVKVDNKLFEQMAYTDKDGKSKTVSSQDALNIWFGLRTSGYVDDKSALTDKYFEDKKTGKLQLPQVEDVPIEAIAKQLDKVFNPETIKIENGKRTRDAIFKQDRFQKAEFQQLWKKINHKTYYSVDFNTEDLIKASVDYINSKLQVSTPRVVVTGGQMDTIESKEALEAGTAMKANKSKSENVKYSVVDNQRYDLIGRIVDATQLTRRTVISILQGLNLSTFNQYKINPEEFIIKVGNLINEKKAIAVIEKITYHMTDKVYESDIFTQSTIRGVLGKNAIESDKSLYDLVVVDSEGIEKNFANDLEIQENVAVYTKLPGGFKINTPVGNYNPDWAVVFKEGSVKHIYFVAETKGSNKEADLREVEKSKIECARRHFATISSSNVKYEVVKDYQTMLDIVSGED